jgi:hypothetical protein
VLWQREWKGEMVKEEMVIEEREAKGKKEKMAVALYFGKPAAF